MSDFPNRQEQERLEGLFARVSSLDLGPDPYFATRVAARAASGRGARRQLFFWRALSAGLGGVALVALAAFALTRQGSAPASLQAEINKPHVVMVKLQELPGLAAAEIELPEGVYFYSESIPGLKEKRELRLAWAPGAKPYLPFVVKGEAEGTRQVTVRFRGQGGELLEERKIEIAFRREKS